MACHFPVGQAHGQSISGATLSLRNGPVGQLDQLGAAAAHLDGNVLKGRAAEMEPRGLAVVGAAHLGQLTPGAVLEFLYGIGWGREHETNLARNCFGRGVA